MSLDEIKEKLSEAFEAQVSVRAGGKYYAGREWRSYTPEEAKDAALAAAEIAKSIAEIEQREKAMGSIDANRGISRAVPAPATIGAKKP